MAKPPGILSSILFGLPPYVLNDFGFPSCMDRDGQAPTSSLQRDDKADVIDLAYVNECGQEVRRLNRRRKLLQQHKAWIEEQVRIVDREMERQSAKALKAVTGLDCTVN